MAKICQGEVNGDPCGADLEALGGISYKGIKISDKFTIYRPACSRCGESIVEFENTRENSRAKRRQEREAAAQGNP